MQTTTEGTFRVLGAAPKRTGSSESTATEYSSRNSNDLLLLDRTDHEPVRVDGGEYSDELGTSVDALRSGYLVSATIAWEDGNAHFERCDIRKRTLFAYVEAVSGLFEAALDVMEEAHRESIGIKGRPTFSTDGEPNGAVYAFAEQAGERDIFGEIRTGSLPLEPLIDRVDEQEDCAHEVFVMDPTGHDFVVVYLVLHRDSILADTVRDTYNCPRPSEN